MHIIVVGAGRIGRHIIDLATKDGHDVYVIEKDEDLAEDISKNYDCKVIVDNATSLDALKDAGADEAHALITTTYDDAVNMLIMSIAKEMGIELLVSSVAEENHIHLFDKMGVGTVESPDKLNAQHLYYTVKNPSVKDFLDLGGDVEIIKFEVSAESKSKGKTIEELEKSEELLKNTRIVVIRRGEDFIIPHPDTKLQEGDRVAILAKQDIVDEISRLFE